MEKSKVMYAITVEDIQNVATETINRKLTNQEIEQIEEKLGDFIDWSDSIISTINYLNIK